MNKKRLPLKKIFIWIGTSAAGAGLILTAGVFYLTNDPVALWHFFSNYKLVKANYFRPVSDAVLFNGALQGMVSSLGDPYSTLLEGKKYSELMEQTSGEYGGIGVVLGQSDTHFYVISVFPGSAAEKSDIRSGDEITAIDGNPTASMDLAALAEAVRGRAGTSVSLALLRSGEPFTISVTRSNITMPTVQGKMAADGIGYIHIYSFTRHTPDEFRSEYEKLQQAGMKKMILDLRMNPGGMVDSVVAVADQILTQGTIVSYRMKTGEMEKFDIQGIQQPIPMAVLIDRGSASAAEILAGAVQDKKEGTIFGETSFGKGTVQTILQTGQDEALKLSIAEYLTAAGRQIDKKGIQPDIAVRQAGQVFDLDHDSVFQRALDFLEGES